MLISNATFTRPKAPAHFGRRSKPKCSRKSSPIHRWRIIKAVLKISSDRLEATIVTPLRITTDGIRAQSTFTYISRRPTPLSCAVTWYAWKCESNVCCLHFESAKARYSSTPSYSEYTGCDSGVKQPQAGDLNFCASQRISIRVIMCRFWFWSLVHHGGWPLQYKPPSVTHDVIESLVLCPQLPGILHRLLSTSAATPLSLHFWPALNPSRDSKDHMGCL